MLQPFSSFCDLIFATSHRTLESGLRLISFYVIPIGIGLISILALATWNNPYSTSGSRPLDLKVLAETNEGLLPQDALVRLKRQPNVRSYDTNLSEAPVWFTMHADDLSSEAETIEFPSRHATDITCWNAVSLQPLGKSSRTGSEGALATVKAGFALQLSRMPTQILCRATFVGPAHLTATQWPTEQLELSAQQYHRKAGLLDGGIIMLALFVLTLALVNRQGLYVLFAAWLFLNLRVGAISAGWDIQWLGQNIPARWLSLSRSSTITLYAVSTLTLYQTLFRDQLEKTRYVTPFRIAQWLCLPLMASAILLPFRIFLPVMWLFAVYGLFLMMLSLGSIMFRSHTRVAFWYATSFGVTFLSSLSEVLAAALGMRELVGVVNSVTAALASSLLAALAIAEQMRLEHQRRIEAQEQFKYTYEAMPVGLFTLDLYGYFISANPALMKMLGATEILAGRTGWKQYFAAGVWSQLHELIHSQTEVELETKNREGTKHFVVKATLARGKIEGFLQDVTEKTKATENLRFMADNDPLTKVFNRRGIERIFEEAIGMLAADIPLTLAYLDLDRFKLINDLFGHTAGDEVLKQVCERIRTMLAAGHRIGRVGGDEFIIVMPDTGIPLASLICRAIVERIGDTPYRVGDKAFQVRGSIGLIEVSGGMQMKDAVSAADRACREAKMGSSAGLIVYEKHAAAFQDREVELNLVKRLSTSNPTAGLFLEMQPIMSLKSPHDSLNFEVLLRMRDPDGSVLTAGSIIPTAEKNGYAGLIDRWVLATTLAWLDTHATHLPNTRFVCMNLSGASLNDERFVKDAIEMLAIHANAASRLCIEITESVALHDLDNTLHFIDQVRSHGAKIALDDFGAGYTSFSYLKKLPADVLKIDGSFVVNINAHPANVAIVEAIVNLAINLGMKTIAEWAEDTATVRTLAELGVDYVQGYAVASSQPPEKLITAVSSASFIQDEELVLLARMLGASSAKKADLLALGKFRDLH